MRPSARTHARRRRAEPEEVVVKLAREYAEKRVVAAVFVCFSVELLQNTQVNTPAGLAIPLDFPMCFPSRRIAYHKPGGKIGSQPPHASCLVLIARRNSQCAARFAEAFSGIGRVIGVER